jgi:tetratricopeptide (TPR) repeat protein
MKILGIRVAGALAASFLGLVTLAQPVQLMAQGTATIHGHVQNAAGMPITAGDVKLTTEKNPSSPSAKFEYTFPLDANGDYKGTVDKPGSYIGAVFVQGHSVDFLPMPIAAGDNKAFDFDMTRKEYIDKMSPADRAQLEEYKKNAAATMAANAKIGNLNNLLKSARAADAAGNYDEAAKNMTDATAAKPDEPILWDTLGDAQLGQANAAAKAAGGKMSDPAVQDKYTAAVTSYQKALALNAATAKPNAELAAAVNNQLGQIYGKTGKTKEAADAYDAAAKADPAKASMYYYNEAATLFNLGNSTGKMDGVVEAADKAIAADPTKVEAYYIKAEGLAPQIAQSADGKSYVPPPGFLEACNKYLELAPTGPHAQELKDLLTGIGQKIETNYKAAPTKKK